MMKTFGTFYNKPKIYSLVLRPSGAGDGGYKRVGVGIIEGDFDVREHAEWQQRTVTIV